MTLSRTSTPHASASCTVFVAQSGRCVWEMCCIGGGSGVASVTGAITILYVAGLSHTKDARLPTPLYVHILESHRI